MSRRLVLERLRNREISVAEAEKLMDEFDWRFAAQDAIRGVKCKVLVYDANEYNCYSAEQGISDDIGRLRSMLEVVDFALKRKSNIAKILSISDAGLGIGVTAPGELRLAGFFGDKTQNVAVRVEVELVSDLTGDNDFDEPTADEDFDEIDGFDDEDDDVT